MRKIPCQNRFSLSLTILLTAVLVTPLTVIAQVALNQPAAQAGVTAEVGRVIVTGSNIPTAEEVGPNPVLNFTRDDINKTGELTTEQFLQSLPIVNANIIPVSNNENGSNT